MFLFNCINRSWVPQWFMAPTYYKYSIFALKLASNAPLSNALDWMQMCVWVQPHPWYKSVIVKERPVSMYFHLVRKPPSPEPQRKGCLQPTPISCQTILHKWCWHVPQHHPCFLEDDCMIPLYNWQTTRPACNIMQMTAVTTFAAG